MGYFLSSEPSNKVESRYPSFGPRDRLRTESFFFLVPIFVLGKVKAPVNSEEPFIKSQKGQSS